MAIGNHHLTISATNQAGVTTTDFKLNKAEPKIPFDFGYRPDHMTILMHESGKTVPPTINWNNAPGTFVLVSSLPAGFDFDPDLNNYALVQRRNTGLRGTGALPKRL